jgi:hypothetical protein
MDFPSHPSANRLYGPSSFSNSLPLLLHLINCFSILGNRRCFAPLTSPGWSGCSYTLRSPPPFPCFLPWWPSCAWRFLLQCLSISYGIRPIPLSSRRRRSLPFCPGQHRSSTSDLADHVYNILPSVSSDRPVFILIRLVLYPIVTPRRSRPYFSRDTSDSSRSPSVLPQLRLASEYHC